MASALAPLTERLRFLVAIRPGIVSPGGAGGDPRPPVRRAPLINVVTGGDPDENRGDGIHLGHAERYEVTDEFLRVWRRVLQGEAVDFHGKHIHVENAKALYPPLQRPYPPLYFGGSEAAHELAGEQVDVYLTWGEPLPAVAAKIADVRQRAARHGRTVKFGIRLHVIVRETAEEAWRAADRLIEHISDETIAAAQQSFARFDSEGQRRMAALHGGRRDRLEIQPNLWAGRPGARGGAGTALVGDPRQVAERIGIRRARHRQLHLLRLSAPGRGLPLRRTGLPAAARTLRQPGRPWADQPDRAVRRNDRQRRAAARAGA